MKNLIIKASGVFTFIFLLTFNVIVTGNSMTEVDFKFEATEAQAHIENEIPCWSQSKVNLTYTYVDCSTCVKYNFRRGLAPQATCTS